jgi:hypothetical protein
MTETWIPGFDRAPGPPEKQGYYLLPRRGLNFIEGDVKHSAEGSMAGLRGELWRPGRRASWHFSIPKAALRSGAPGEQHYPLEAIAWHCGVKGDIDTLTELIGNVTLAGIEHEGKAGEPLTAHQVRATVAISRFLREHTFAGTRPPALAVNLWEHAWLSATACPSGRVPWGAIVEALKEREPKVTLNVPLLQKQGKPHIFADFGEYLVHVPRREMVKAPSRVLPESDPIWRKLTVLRDMLEL